MQLDHAPFELVLPRRQHILVFWIARIERVAAAQYDAPIRIRHIESAGAAKREIHTPEAVRGAMIGPKAAAAPSAGSANPSPSARCRPPPGVRCRHR
jgi:hypothetical protein